MFVYAQADQHVVVGSVPHYVSKGECWDETDPLVKAWPDLFGKTPPKVCNTQGHDRVHYENAEFSPEVRRRAK